MTLAQLADATKMHEGDLSKAETADKYNPKLSTIQKLAAALGVRPADLLPDAE